MANEIKMIVNPTFPAYASKKYSGFFLMRFFQNEEHRNYFLSGKLYMRSQTDFSKEEYGIGRDDWTEGADLVVAPWNQETFPDVRFVTGKDGSVAVQVTEYKERPEGYRDNQFFVNYPLTNQKRNIYCMYTLWCNTKENLLSNIDIKGMKSFGEYGVLITDWREFFNRVGQAVKDEVSVSQMNCGFVNYIEDSNMKNVMKMNPFIKPAKGFNYQNEFRFCADTDNTNLLELDAHIDFRDIAVPIRLNDFAKTVSFNDGCLKCKPDFTEEL